MIRLLLTNLKRMRGMAALFLIAFALIFIIMPLALHAIKDSNTSIQSDITFYSRGTYDLLVRAPEAIQPVEKELGIVPENYLGAGEGGISLQQWEAIKKRDDVEIAAPVASLGYYSGIATSLAIIPEPEESTRYTVDYYTSDGLNSYSFEKYSRLFLESPIAGEKFDELFSRFDIPNGQGSTVVFPLPTAHHLLVGIDPIEEKKLTGIEFEGITYGSEKHGGGVWQVKNNPIFEDGFAIPVAQLENVIAPFEVKVTVDKLPITEDDTKKIRDEYGLNDNPPYNEFINTSDSEEYARLVKKLIDYPSTETKTLQADLNTILRPFNVEENSIFIDENEELREFIMEGDYVQELDYFDASIYYVANPLDYEIVGDHLIVKQVESSEVNKRSSNDLEKWLYEIIERSEPIPAYREVIQKGKSARFLPEGESLDYIVDPVSSFTISKKEEQLASSPLGIYHLAPITYMNGEERIEMTPTYSPGGYVSSPAEGVTNIQAAEKVKGDKPIDAIRVKVAGITSYTKDAKEQIEKLAKEIEEMGLTATIIAGASPRKVQIDVEGVGLVEESWTSLGASGSIVRQWNVTNMILTIAFLIVAVVYIIHRMRIWQSQKQADVSLLMQLGWERNKISRLMGGEIALLTMMSWFISIAVLWLIKGYLNVSSVVLVIQAITFLLTIVTLFILAISRIKASVKHRFEEIPKGKKNWKSLLMKNIYHYRKQIISPFIQLLVVSGLSSFVYLSLTKTVAQTNMTVLGEYINTQTSGWHLLLIFGAYALATITMIESISSVMVSKKREIATYLSIGWKVRHIFNLYFKEIMVWSGVALLLGNLISFVLYVSFYPFDVSSIIILVLTFAGFYLVILGLSAFILKSYLKNNIGDSLVLRRT